MYSVEIPIQSTVEVLDTPSPPAVADHDPDDDFLPPPKSTSTHESEASQLRLQMQKDALQPRLPRLHGDMEDDPDELTEAFTFGVSNSSRRRGKISDEDTLDNEIETLQFSEDEVAEAREFLSMPVSYSSDALVPCLCSCRLDLSLITRCTTLKTKERLDKILSYLRLTYSYCFWCGMRYDNQEDMQNSCPGETEEDHD